MSGSGRPRECRIWAAFRATRLPNEWPKKASGPCKGCSASATASAYDSSDSNADSAARAPRPGGWTTHTSMMS